MGSRVFTFKVIMQDSPMSQFSNHAPGMRHPSFARRNANPRGHSPADLL